MHKNTNGARKVDLEWQTTQVLTYTPFVFSLLLCLVLLEVIVP